MKRITKSLVSLSVLLAVVIALFPAESFASSSVKSGAGSDAEMIILKASSSDLPKNKFYSLVDNNLYSKFEAENDIRIEFHAFALVKNLYIAFENLCEWKLGFHDDAETQYSENGFLHEYISFGREPTDFYIDLPAGGAVAEVYAFSEGKLPDWVQIWKPPCERADLMVMPAHADDEFLWFCGALPYYAGELGYNVQVVYLTDHVDATYRRHELLNGLWRVGVRNYPVLTDRFPDDLQTKKSLESAEAFFGRDRVTEFQVEMLRRFAPRVVLAHDINGEYGHGAHKLNAATLLDALKIYDDPSVYPESAKKYGTRKVQKCYLHLWKENQIFVRWDNMHLKRFGGKTALEMAVKGYHCHESQSRYSFQIEAGGKYDCRKFGLAYTTVGYDTPEVNDMFENVDMNDDDIVEEPPEDSPQVTETISETDSEAEKPLRERKTGITICGRELSIGDMVFVSVAAVLVIASFIIVICLKRRR